MIALWARALAFAAVAITTARSATTPLNSERTAVPRPPANFSSDSVATRALLMLQMSEFNLAWQLAWRDSERQRLSVKGGREIMERRSEVVHCHPDGSNDRALYISPTQAAFAEKMVSEHRLLESKESWYAACPSWMMLFGFYEAGEEGDSRDGALIDTMRPRVRNLRGVMIARLDSAAAQFPRDGWIAGQRVRLRLDQNDFTNAVANAIACAGERWWCAALRGYAYTRSHDAAKAERAFNDMRSAMTPAQQCSWEDVRELLSASDRKAYGVLTCDARTTANAKLWWLSDPLLRTAGNERLVEQESRRVEIALRKAMSQDERYTWLDDYGGDALTSLISRYGWPSYTGWMDDGLDVSHTGYLAMHDSPRATPYTSFEYTLDRVHTLPAWSTVRSPFAATESSWFLSHDDEAGNVLADWWPDEHFRPARRLVQLFEGQSGLFRRQSQILLAAATELSHPALVPEAHLESKTLVSELNAKIPETLVRTSRYDVLLLSSTSPARIDSLDQQVSMFGSTVAMQGLIPSTPAIVGIEARGLAEAEVDARSRFGIVPPTSLDAFKPGEIASSDPVLIDAQDGQLDVRSPSDALLQHMLGSTTLPFGTRRVALYWETYGIHATDTVTVAVSVAGDKDLSTLKRIGMALNVASDPNRSISQRWTEPSVEHGTSTMAGMVPVQMRALILNLSALPAGPYVLEVSLTRRDGKVVTGRRKLTLAD